MTRLVWSKLVTDGVRLFALVVLVLCQLVQRHKVLHVLQEVLITLMMREKTIRNIQTSHLQVQFGRKGNAETFGDKKALKSAEEEHL